MRTSTPPTNISFTSNKKHNSQVRQLPGTPYQVRTHYIRTSQRVLVPCFQTDNNTTHILAAPPPVTLAHALTIHKAQGQTYDVVVVVGTRIFLPGQAYTALSRARTLAGLYCVDLVPEHIEVPWPDNVAAFCNSVPRALAI